MTYAVRVINSLLILMMLLFLGFLGSCELEDAKKQPVQDKKSAEDELYHYEAFSLVPFGIQAFLYLPDETANIGVTEPNVAHEMDSFKWVITLSKDFVIRIDDWGQDSGIAVQKRIMEENKKIFDIHVIESTEDVLFYKLMVKTYEAEQKEEKALYYYFHQHTIDGINFVFGTPHSGSPKNIIDFIQKSAASVEEVLVTKL